MKLEKINSLRKLKRLKVGELPDVCKEIRSFLIESISKTGGHLASNLGVVELTVALHYCFNSPIDRLIWDVGHQAYVHKILTGRMDQFPTLRKFAGLSGFPKGAESEHDAFDTGHSSTSISAALGLCVSRDLSGDKYKVIAVIGDGSLTGGLAFEGLNNAGRKNTNIIVILNDNQMSISENVGALSSYLNEFRTAKPYLEAKQDVSNFLNKVPLVGPGLTSFIDKTKSGIKQFLVPGQLFEELGFTYIGPVDGHNIRQLVSVLNKVKNMQGPVLVHVCTKKGKGYEQAESAPQEFHGVSPFDIETGEINQSNKLTYSQVFGQALTELAAQEPRLLAVTASMQDGTGLSFFKEKFPNRIFDVGIAESHAVTFSAGLAKNGYLPVFAVYSSFLQRSYDQILHDVCLQKLPMIFAIDRAGIVGADGETHQGIFDLSFLSHIPNLSIMAPKDGAELKQMLDLAVRLNAPVAIRYPRDVVPSFLPDNAICSALEYAKHEVFIQGENIALVALGSMFQTALQVSRRLRSDGLSPCLINARFMKPISDTLCEELEGFEHIFIMEENVATGGFGSSLLMKLNALSSFKGRVHILAFKDEFIPQGTRNELLAYCGLDEEGVYETVKRHLMK